VPFLEPGVSREKIAEMIIDRTDNARPHGGRALQFGTAFDEGMYRTRKRPIVRRSVRKACAGD
jgi:hypothetical protein